MSYNRDMPTGNCQKCINTFGTLGCCDTISNEWRYNCDDGMRYFDERKMKLDERINLCKAVDTYGVDAQCKMAIEEMSELTKELCKYFRGADNADKIRAMDDAELTRFFAENCGCGDWCMHNRSGACARKDEYSCCLDVWHDWLKSPVYGLSCPSKD